MKYKLWKFWLWCHWHIFRRFNNTDYYKTIKLTSIEKEEAKKIIDKIFKN